ncbi:MAG: HAD-IA family hydrolase, partial [Pseudomonadota bacterium]
MSPQRNCTFSPTEIDWVILDMDGTLLDLHFDDQVWNHQLPSQYAKQEGITLEEAKEKISSMMDPIRGTLLWYCFDHWQLLTNIDLCAIENEVYNLVGPRPGAEDFLIRLSDYPATTVLATNADRRSMERKLSHTGLDKYFGHIVSSHDFGFAKETNAFWSRLQSTLGFANDKVLFIDDNHNVLRAAHE